MLYYLFLIVTDIAGTHTAILERNMTADACLELGQYVLQHMKAAYPNDVIELICRKQAIRT